MSTQGHTELNLDRQPGDEHQAVCHLMPCRIDHNEVQIKAKEYFWPTIKELKKGGDNDQGRKAPSGSSDEGADQSPILTASFRGRPLQGRCIKLPEGYSGHVISKPNNKFKSINRNQVIDKHFDQFTYWNWDQLPAKTDTVPKALEWLEVAKAIHEPI